jgi:hypothetical protein
MLQEVKCSADGPSKLEAGAAQSESSFQGDSLRWMCGFQPWLEKSIWQEGFNSVPWILTECLLCAQPDILACLGKKSWPSIGHTDLTRDKGRSFPALRLSRTYVLLPIPPGASWCYCPSITLEGEIMYQVAVCLRVPRSLCTEF